MKPRWDRVAVMFGVVVLGAMGFVHYITHVVDSIGQAAAIPDPRPSHVPGPHRAETVPPATARPAVAARPAAPVPSSFGTFYQIERGDDGRVTSARARLEELPRLKRAAGSYDPTDPRQVLARSRQVLAELGAALGISAETQLEQGPIRAESGGGQVVLHQLADGVRVMPGGTLTLDLGPQGEVLGVYSELAPITRVSGSYRLPVDEAKLRALASVPNAAGYQKTIGGNKVVWVGEKGEARRAYEYYVQGRQIIVDAEEGRVLFNRDRRSS